MSQFSFNPFEDGHLSFYESDPMDEAEYEEDMPDGAQELPPGAHGFSVSESEEPPPEVCAENNYNDITFTSTAEIRTVLATLSHFKGGQLGRWLSDQKGLIILPLSAVTAIRTTTNNHKLEYPTILFYPQCPIERYNEVFPELMSIIENLYQ